MGQDDTSHCDTGVIVFAAGYFHACDYWYIYIVCLYRLICLNIFDAYIYIHVCIYIRDVFATCMYIFSLSFHSKI